MNPVFTNLFQFLRNILLREEGQDLVEYALVVALIAFGAVAGIQFLSSSLNTVFSEVGGVISSNIT